MAAAGGGGEGWNIRLLEDDHYKHKFSTAAKILTDDLFKCSSAASAENAFEPS